jgi:hypothetical protein
MEAVRFEVLSVERWTLSVERSFGAVSLLDIGRREESQLLQISAQASALPHTIYARTAPAF